jgi:signal transduction histidine kinase
METQRLYRALASSDSARIAEALTSADSYLTEAWDALGSAYVGMKFLDAAGDVLYALGDARDQGSYETAPTVGDLGESFVATRPIRDTESGAELGALVATIRLRELLPREALATSFGRDGYSVVLDRSADRVLYHPRRAFLRQPLSELLGSGAWNADPHALTGDAGSLRYEEDEARHLASFVSLSDPQWTVISSASVDEFAAPFARTRAINLLLVLVVAVVISVAFLLVTSRMTRSLGELTTAADRVAAGDFSPPLPPAGSDEIGRLSAAFGIMANQVGETMKRIRESRHMAAVGEFASQLSHEIRNPLTSVKLNLQRLQRGIRGGGISEAYAEPVEICLGEVQRLDRVVRGVLSMARTGPLRQDVCSVQDEVEGALQVLGHQLEAQGIRIEKIFQAVDDRVIGDDEQLKGVFLNLLLNAMEAMPDGGRLAVSTETHDGPFTAGPPAIRVRVMDEGPGVAPELRERIFEPFFSTKEEGTGFGLALAQQIVEEHHGRLDLDTDAALGEGAQFVVELPLARIREPITTSTIPT